MTRIAGGRWASRRLTTPPGTGTRPTSERVREAIANALVARDEVVDARVLDLFAGSGAVGLELASRGAAAVTFVESDQRAAGVIKKNIMTLTTRAVPPPPQLQVVAGNARSFIAATPETFTLVFMDPPYDVSQEVLTALLADIAHVLTPGALVVVERARRSGPVLWPENYTVERVKRYGDTIICYGRAP